MRKITFMLMMFHPTDEDIPERLMEISLQINEKKTLVTAQFYCQFKRLKSKFNTAENPP